MASFPHTPSLHYFELGTRYFHVYKDRRSIWKMGVTSKLWVLYLVNGRPGRPCEKVFASFPSHVSLCVAFANIPIQILSMIPRNLAWKEVKTPILDEKARKNVPKLSLNMPSKNDIPEFHLEDLFMFHLIQLWLGKHQLTYMILAMGKGRLLMSKHFKIVNSWIKECNDILGPKMRWST